MHTMWKGSISFGLVNVPVRMFAATESKDIKFKYLHKECKTPIQNQRICPKCEQNVDWNDIVRGYEFEPDRYVIFDDEEINALKKSRSQTIDIVDFVQLSEIDPVYYDKTYFLAPDSSGAKAYRLLQAAMEQTGKIAIAKTVLRNAETLACVRIYKDVIVMETLFWPDEVRSIAELPSVFQTQEVAEKELDMAVKLIEQLATPFDPEKYHDDRREEIINLIQDKVANQQTTVAASAPKRQNIVDLMQALQESIKMTKPPTKKKKKTS